MIVHKSSTSKKLNSPRKLDKVDKPLFIHLTKEVHAPLIAVVTLFMVKDVESDESREKTNKDERV